MNLTVYTGVFLVGSVFRHVPKVEEGWLGSWGVASGAESLEAAAEPLDAAQP